MKVSKVPVDGPDPVNIFGYLNRLHFFLLVRILSGTAWDGAVGNSQERIGMVILATAPLSRPLARLKEQPWCSSMMRLETDNPKPVPCFLVV